MSANDLLLAPDCTAHGGCVVRLVRLSSVQREFLNSIYPHSEEEEQCYWECHYFESKTALALEKRGVVEFSERPEKGCDWFMARISKQALKYYLPNRYYS